VRPRFAGARMPAPPRIEPNVPRAAAADR